MTLEQYQAEYERLFGWRERWTRLSNHHEPGRLQTRQEAIERRAGIANNRIGSLMRAYDKECRVPYINNITAFVRERGAAYRQEIFDRFQTAGRTNSRLVADSIKELEKDGLLIRQNGPCSTHKGPLYRTKLKRDFESNRAMATHSSLT